MKYFIDKTINALKQRLQENNGVIRIQSAEGHLTYGTCKFFEPLDNKEILSFEKELGYKLPEDYIRFLQITNGCKLFDHPEYGGESYLYGLYDIFELTYEEPNDGYLKIGYFYTNNIVIDLRAFNAGDLNYILVKGHIDQFYEARKLNMNFELWLDRFIMSQGALFWNWLITAEKYYKNK